MYKLKEEWKQCWKWLQTQLGALICLAPILYDQAEAIQRFTGPRVFRYTMAILGALVVLNSIRKKDANKTGT